ncbi:MAG: peptide-methionine (S)-S-oxide reductase MsrA [Planctomycetaceae bacterium]
MPADSSLQTATLGGGCFWCLEAVFQQLRGVRGVASGFSGGHVENPTYEAACSGKTGHAEVVQIQFDSAVISFADLLDVFFHTHDPTTMNRQGNDVGTQYRSAIFFHDDGQRAIAEETIRRLSDSGEFADPIVTEVAAFDAFYSADGDHEDYFRRNPQQAYCRFVIRPKLEKFQQSYADRLRGDGQPGE